MSQGTEHHIEEAEHAQHAAHHPFDKRVAMTMAIVAAALAAVTLLSHRAHNEVLQDQINSAKRISKESDQWAYYQAKKNREYIYEADAALLKLTAGASLSADQQAQVAEWQKGAAKYKEETKDIEKEAKGLRRVGRSVPRTVGNRPPPRRLLRPRRTRHRTVADPIFDRRAGPSGNCSGSSAESPA